MEWPLETIALYKPSVITITITDILFAFETLESLHFVIAALFSNGQYFLIS